MEFVVPPKVFCLLVGQEIPGKLCITNQHPNICHECRETTTKYLAILYRLFHNACALPEGISHNKMCIACGEHPPYGKGLCWDCYWPRHNLESPMPLCEQCGDGPVVYGRERLCFSCFLERYCTQFTPFIDVPAPGGQRVSILPTEDSGDGPLCEHCCERPVRRKGKRAERICDPCYRRRRYMLAKQGMIPHHLCPQCKKRRVAGAKAKTLCGRCLWLNWRKQRKAAGLSRTRPLPVPRPLCEVCNKNYVRNRGITGARICWTCTHAKNKQKEVLPVPRPLCAVCKKNYIRNKGIRGEHICNTCHNARRRKRIRKEGAS